MTKEDLKRLLDTAYELEGLIQLALSRDDNEQIQNLIASKASTICELCGHMEQPSAAPAIEAEELQSEAYELQEEEEEEETPAVQAEYDLDRNEIADASQFEEQQDSFEPTAESAKEQRPSLKSLVTLNDKFRFQQNVFGGSRERMEDAFSFIDHLDALYEAEDYIYNDLDLDPDSPDVQALVSVIEKHFNQ